MELLYQFFGAFILSLVITPIVRYISIRTGNVAEVKLDRWHMEPKALMGGVAIWAAWLMVCLPYANDPKIITLLIASTAIFLVGVVDDIIGLNPQAKLVCQIVVVASMIPFGFSVEIIPYPALAIPITIFWVVGITNSFNLLDNMDGLSAGVALISSVAVGYVFYSFGNTVAAGVAFSLAGACLGFLKYNFNPASIFMGDCGSLFIGFVLSSLTIAGSWMQASNLLTTLALPLVILGIPIFDTAFVTLNRKLNGRPISKGGKDHLSHKLVYLGLSEKHAVLVLYAFSAFLGAATIYYNKVNPIIFTIVSVFFAVGLYYVGMYLGETEKNVVPDYKVLEKKKKIGILSKRRIGEILIDIILITSAYYFSYLLRYDGRLLPVDIKLFTENLSWIIVCKLLIFSYMGLYKSIWKYVGLHEAMDILKAVVLSSFVIITVILMTPSRFAGYSRAVFIIDAAITVIFVGGARFMMLVIREFILNLNLKGRRIIIVGAGDAGSMVLKEIKNNSSLDYRVVGFIDDDSKKHNTEIHGVPVLGNTLNLISIANNTEVSEVVIAIPSANKANLKRILSICKKGNIKYGTFPIVKKLLDRMSAGTRGLRTV